MFKPTPGNYTDGSSVNGNCGQSQVANSFLREITKLSQINLSRLSHHKCSYTVLSSSSRDDSTESLLHHQCSGSESVSQEGEEQDTPNKNMMVKSQSANILSRRKQQELSPSAPDDEPNSPVIAPVIRHHSGCSKGLPPMRKRVSVAPAENRISLTRDPISVPNFGAFSSLPTPVLTPVEVTQLVFVDTDDDNETEDIFASQSYDDHVIQVHPSSRDFSVIHQQFQPHTVKKRSDSYNSHLLSAGEPDSLSPVYQSSGKSPAIPKSASVRFRAGHPVTELEEASDETVSTSDYASIETVNRIASASNYSMYNKPTSIETRFPQNETKFNGKSNGKAKTPNKDGPFGFCNPNYLGPDIQTILASAGQRKSWHVTTPTSSENIPPTSKQHFQSYARLLNSPPDSVLEDATGRSISRQFYQEELLELQNLDSSCSQPHSLATTPCVPTPNRGVCTERVPPQFLALNASYGSNPMGVEKRKKSRASSASRAEKQMFGHEPEDEEDLSYFSTEPSVPLYMFVLGGKEQGQVTVFKRPVSVWKLQLAPNIF